MVGPIRLGTERKEVEMDFVRIAKEKQLETIRNSSVDSRFSVTRCVPPVLCLFNFNFMANANNQKFASKSSVDFI